MPSDRSKQLFISGSIVEDGFYYPSRNHTRPAVDANGFRHIPIAGLSDTVQFFRVRLVEPESGTSSEHVVLSAHDPRLADTTIISLDAALRSHAPGGVLSFTLEDRAGWARALAESPGPLAAAAVAIVKASSGWDESDPIVVELARGSFDVRLRHEGESWIVSVWERER
ncbi:hypothetical protein ACMHYB_35735 [Sorangium sp. So ce1128]